MVKQGNRLKYVTKSGEEMIEFRKNWTPEKLDTVMNEWNDENLNDEKHELEQVKSEV